MSDVLEELLALIEPETDEPEQGNLPRKQRPVTLPAQLVQTAQEETQDGLNRSVPDMITAAKGKATFTLPEKEQAVQDALTAEITAAEKVTAILEETTSSEETAPEGEFPEANAEKAQGNMPLTQMIARARTAAKTAKTVEPPRSADSAVSAAARTALLGEAERARTLRKRAEQASRSVRSNLPWGERENASGERVWNIPQDRRSGRETPEIRKIDRAFERDARRYDGGFTLY